MSQSGMSTYSVSCVPCTRAEDVPEHGLMFWRVHHDAGPHLADEPSHTVSSNRNRNCSIREAAPAAKVMHICSLHLDRGSRYLEICGHVPCQRRPMRASLQDFETPATCSHTIGRWLACVDLCTSQITLHSGARPGSDCGSMHCQARLPLSEVKEHSWIYSACVCCCQWCDASVLSSRRHASASVINVTLGRAHLPAAAAARCAV